MFIACDEAGHTGPDLLSKEQKFFAFASVNVTDEEAFEILKEARSRHPVQMPELKASKLMSSGRGRSLIGQAICAIDGRFAVNAHDKLLALCGWVFEYVYEPVFKDEPRILYQKDFHRFVAMFCYLWLFDGRSEARDGIAQFQAYMRTGDIESAPILFNYRPDPGSSASTEPFDMVRRFATGHREAIRDDNADIAKHLPQDARWVLDLSASGLWSHLNHWGQKKQPLTIICDDSKPLKAIAPQLNRRDNDPAVSRAAALFGAGNLGWEQTGPIAFADSRSHPSIQLADLIASASVSCFSRGVPEDFQITAELLERHMLRDSIFPDFDRVQPVRAEVRVMHLVLEKLAQDAEGSALPMPLDAAFEVAEAMVRDAKPQQS